MIADTTFNARLGTLNEKFRTLITNDSAGFFNELTFHSINSYSFHPNNPLFSFTKNGRYDIIEKLLFSPNHIVAIYAYELLRTKPGLPPETTLQMEKVFNSPIKIKWMWSDVGYSGKTYKELRRTP